jgi:NAD(P)-dependent dehydrogenase (short-subunit alcohol dehydrogenase family)
VTPWTLQLSATLHRAGGHRGTGQRIAARLAEEGATVLVHGFTPAEASASCTTIGHGIAVAGDITTDAGAAELLASCAAAAPPIEILVNNYGIAGPGKWDDAGTDAWLGMYQHNVLSAQRLIRALLPAMRTRKWGRIINLGTVGSTRPAARMPHYYASKGALATLTMSLAKEVAGAGITVNLVSPGLIHTAEVEASYLAQGAATVGATPGRKSSRTSPPTFRSAASFGATKSPIWSRSSQVPAPMPSTVRTSASTVVHSAS